MRVKKFEAKNMKDALQMVKNELGPDAVILSARDNRKSYGIAGGPSVEITAAVSESTLQKKQFVESRMTANDRAKFQNSDARTQRRIIEKMVDARIRVRAEDEQRETRRRPITSVSYIDIPDEEIETHSPRRSAALDKAKGRSVADLLEDFDRDFQTNNDEDESWQERPVRAAAPQSRPNSSPRMREQNARGYEERRAPSSVPQSAARGREPQSAARGREPQRAAQVVPLKPTEPGKLPVSETALSRIRNAARDAWKAGLEVDLGPKKDKNARAASSSNTGHESSTHSSAPGSGGMEMVPIEKNDPEILTLKNEINRLQQMIEGFQKVPQTFVTMHPGAEYGVSYDLSFMYQKLVESGITIDNTVEILAEAAKSIDPMQIKKRPIVDAWVARWLLSHISVNPTPWAGRVHLFVGGAGSGKTSTLVKMASHLVVREKKKVAILSTDSFKVGAVDQMKIYCQILNVPFAVIRNRKDWEWVLSQLKGFDHILVDFPGFQLRDLEEIQLLKSLLPPTETNPVCHFCVSATSKDGDAYEIAKRYKATGYDDLIITNLDQSVQHGIIHNLQKKTAKPLHSFGIGSRIPEDFEAASKERVLDLIFKLTKLKRETN